MAGMILLAAQIVKLGVFTAIRELAGNLTRATVGSLFNVFGFLFGGFMLSGARS